MEDTLCACEVLEQNMQLIIQNKELLARCDVLNAEIAALKEAVTPSAETKAAYMGEFSFCTVEFDDGGEEFARVLDVPWTTIKDIMKAVSARAGADLLKEGES